MIGWIALSDGLIDRNGKPIGTDFSNYAAGTLTWKAGPRTPTSRPLQHAAEKAVFGGREVPFYGWHYPPFFFAGRRRWSPRCPMRWGAGDLAWRRALPPTWRSIRAILPAPGNAGCVAAAFPAVFVNVGHGQNGFLTAALLGGALLSARSKAAGSRAC